MDCGNNPTQILREVYMLKLMKAALVASVFVAGASVVQAGGHKKVDAVKFLIPGGAGGGWDGTARGTGEALTKSGLVGNATYENMSGGGGGKAIAHIIETKDQNTLMVNSTPIVIRSLTKVFPQSFRDLTPIAGTIGDYGAMVVGKNSEIGDLNGLVEAYKANPTTAGGKAMAGLLSGEIQALTTGFGEAIELARQGEVKILCVTADARVAASKDTPTCSEAGSTGTSFVNWRGFFAAPGLSDEKKAAYISALKEMYATPEWATVRDRNGWVDIFNADADFVKFLEGQEEQIGGLMKELGFL